MNVSKSIWHRRGEDVQRISADEISPGSHVSSERSVLPWLPIERVPKPMLCVPLLAHWMWLAMRYRSLTLPSAINPAIETGGLAGESKSAGLAQISETSASFVAPWRLVGPGEDPVAARRAAGFAYPLIAKPDIGWCGFGVRRIEDDGALSSYAAAFPPAASFIVQHLVTAPMEAGLFYLRQPASSRGRLPGDNAAARPSCHWRRSAHRVRTDLCRSAHTPQVNRLHRFPWNGGARTHPCNKRMRCSDHRCLATGRRTLRGCVGTGHGGAGGGGRQPRAFDAGLPPRPL